ncbi:hypothetical protein N7461_000264 [Penicillium sp. DV-2018c]|nr:hypothetical protein N7461_000264 [Penicillium sp. DV-2018c]
MPTPLRPKASNPGSIQKKTSTVPTPLKNKSRTPGQLLRFLPTALYHQSRGHLRTESRHARKHNFNRTSTFTFPRGDG